MRQNDFLYLAIHQYLQAGIRTGVFEKGTFLPPIQELCESFSVGPSTIRLALQMLEEEGCVRLRKGCPAEVVWTGDPQAADSRRYAARSEGIADFNRHLSLLYTPLCLQGLLAAREDDLSALEKAAQKLDAHHLFAILQFFLHLLLPLGNQLILLLFIDIAVYRQFPGLSALRRETEERLSLLRDHMLATIAARRRGDFAGMRNCMEAFFRHAPDDDLLAPPAEPRPIQLPFEWRPYKGRNQYCFQIARDVIEKMCKGVYMPFMPLPNPSEMAEEYGVSVRAVRQALKLLNHMGLVETINGVGSQTRSLQDKAVHSDWSDSAVKKNITAFLQALQIVVITCEGIILESFPLLSEPECEELQRVLEADIHPTASNGVSEYRRLLFKKIPSPAISEIYGHLFQLTVWGYASLFRVGYRERSSEWKGMVQRMIDALRRRDAASLAAASQRLFCSYFVHCRCQAVCVGIEGAVEVAVPVLEEDPGAPS